MNQPVQLVILVVAERTAKLSRVVLVYTLRIHYITDTEDIIDCIILIAVIHYRQPLDGQCGVLQPLTLLVKRVGGLHTVAELGVNGVPVFIVAYLLDKGLLFAELVARKAFHLPRSIVVISNHLAVGIGHRAHAVPTVVGGAVDVGAYVGKARHDRPDGLNNLALSAVIVGFATGVVEVVPCTRIVHCYTEEFQFT